MKHFLTISLCFLALSLSAQLGCTDYISCNYNPIVSEDDGSCIYIDSPIIDMTAYQWLLSYDWGCDGSTGTTETTFNENGTWINLNVNAGNWSLCSTLLQWNFDPQQTFIYSGSWNGSGFVGTMDNFLGDTGCFTLYPIITPGCTTTFACNYDPFAIEDDGSCEYTSCLGCTTSFACNYDPEATVDDGSCIFICEGCTDESACNYDPSANVDDSSCEYLSCYGCTDAIACNYNSSSTLDDGSCIYPDQYYDCFNNCLNDSDSDGICDALEILGCTDQGSCNYDMQATDDNESCEFETCAGCQYEVACNYDPEATIANNESCEYGTCPGCTDSIACNFNPTLSEDDGSCEYPNFPYNCNGNCQNDADLDGICDEEEECFFNFGDVVSGYSPDYTLGETFNNAYVTEEYHDVFHILIPTYASDVNDTYPPTLPIDSIILDLVTFVNTITWVEYQPYELGLEVICNNSGDLGNNCSFLGGEQYCIVLQGVPNTSGVFIISFNTKSWFTIFEPFYDPNFLVMSGGINIYDCLSYDNCGNCDNDPTNDCVQDCNGVWGGIIFEDECGVCGGAGIPEGECDCIGTLLDECGVCGGDGIPEGECDCDGNVLDECVVCGGDGIPVGDCDCDGNILDASGICGGACEDDYNSNGVCDDQEVYGCTYTEAMNFDSLATVDDGSCAYYGAFNPCPSDLDGNGIVGSPDLLLFLSEYGDVCE